MRLGPFQSFWAVDFLKELPWIRVIWTEVRRIGGYILCDHRLSHKVCRLLRLRMGQDRDAGSNQQASDQNTMARIKYLHDGFPPTRRLVEY